MTKNKTLFFIALCAALIELSTADCLDSWVRFGDSCYFFGHDDKSFQDAERYCVHFHAHLTNIETSSEGAFIRSFLADLKYPKHWIGVTDEVIEGVWKYYPSETTAHYQDWSPGEPNEGKSANCAAIWGSYGYHWVDESCSGLFKPICERPANYEEVVGR